MLRGFTSHLYVRIWLAVVLAVVVITLGAGWAWRLSRDDDAPPPVRELVVRNEAGQVIGTAQTDSDRRPGQPLRFEVQTTDGRTLDIELPRRARGAGPGTEMPGHMNGTVRGAVGAHMGPGGPGPGFGFRPPFGFGFGWLLALVGLAVALGAYPIIRRLTQRLESLQRGVERWGSGDLSARVSVQGSDEVAFLAERFNHAAERIESLVSRQQDLLKSHKTLLANASHELRSPLTRIRMGLELLGGADPAAQARQRAEIAQSIAELDQLIDEILLASRLEAGQTEHEPMELVDLTGLAAEECARVGAELVVAPGSGSDGGAETGKGEGARGPASSYWGTRNRSPAPGPLPLSQSSSQVAPDEGGLMLLGSPRLLRRLLRNLLENARRYSDGAVTVVLEASAGGQAVIRVNDLGPGVPPELRERIFEPFYRLPGASEREGGVGLGLALVKSIAERHGGSVRCEANDTPGGGASFVVTLPLG
jgi:signal transduction histidine kinase